MNAELFFESGLEIRSRSPLPDTFALGCHERHDRLPAARRGPPARRLEDRRERYAVPDLIFQVHPHPVALHPGSERRAVEATLRAARAAPRLTA